MSGGWRLWQDSTKRELSDRHLLEIFLQPENVHLYQDIETVMSVMVKAALLISVESIVESWISTIEHHSSQRRTMGNRGRCCFMKKWFFC